MPDVTSDNSEAGIHASTPDLHEEIIAALRDLIPGAFPDGELDAGLLMETLGLTEPPRPAFTFSWPGISQARFEARVPTTATLVPDPDASLNWEEARDVLIEGDNLQVLKLLKNGYTGAAKLIYIDPNYNVGETFTYSDDFAVPEAEYLRMTGQVDEQGNPLTSDLEKGGRKHAPWLTMMFPRLVLARHLLRRDGVILISIDNNEAHHLRLLLDATFGASNFIDMMTWQGGRKGDAKFTAGGQDYILIYARDFQHLKDLDTRWRERKTGLEPVYAKANELIAKYGEDFDSARAELKEWYDSLPEGNPSKQHSHYDHLDEGGVWTSDNSSSPNFRGNLVFDFNGYSPPSNGWRYERGVMERLDSEGKLLYPKTQDGRIRIKRYLREQEEWSPASTFHRDRSAASGSLTQLMGGKVFDNPKSVDVLGRLIHAITGEGDLVIDFFGGSGSTAEAVWTQNATDGLNRNWLLVQAPEPPDESSQSGKRAIEEGYETIFEIAAERIRRVAAKSDGVRLGFRVFRARPTNLRTDPPIVVADGMPEEAYVQSSLEAAETPPVIDGAEAISVIWEILLKSSTTKLDAELREIHGSEVNVYEVLPSTDEVGRLLVSLEAFDMATADGIALTDRDTLIVRADVIDDGTAITLASRMGSHLILVERVPRAVSL